MDPRRSSSFSGPAELLGALVREQIAAGGGAVDRPSTAEPSGLDERGITGADRLEQAARLLGDPCLGFHLALEFDLRRLGALHYLLASAETLGGILSTAVRYRSMFGDGADLHLSRSVDTISLRFRFGDPRRQRHLQIGAFWVATLLRECRQLTARDIRPVEIVLADRRGDGLGEMSRFFGSPIVFRAGRYGLTLDRRIEDTRIETADPYLQGLIAQHVQEAMTDGTPPSLRARIEAAMAARLTGGSARIGTIAMDLGLSTRTLSRRLAGEDLTFSGILDEMRADLAVRYLADPSWPVSSIARQLGYRETSAFTVAFRRWTGMAPSEARARHRA